MLLFIHEPKNFKESILRLVKNYLDNNIKYWWGLVYKQNLAAANFNGNSFWMKCDW